MKELTKSILFALIGLIIALILITGCSQGVYPNYRHNTNKTHTDYYGNRYKWHGIMKEYQHRRYGFESNPF